MAGLKQFEFFVLRYVPDAVKQEFVNFGVALYEPGAIANGFGGVRVTRDWRRVRCHDPQVDIEMLEAVVADIRQCLLDPVQREGMLRRLLDPFSNLIQISTTQGVLAEDAEEELEILASMQLDTTIPVLKLPARGRPAILARMVDEFERRAILKLLMRDVPMSSYTRTGDPMKLDFGYGVAKELKFLHAVSLWSRVDHAVVLAARFPTIVSGVKVKHGSEARLIAVVDDDLDRSRDEVGFALGMMEENRIRVARASEIPAIAEQVRSDLRA
jgi:hypothetical protein